MTWGKMVRHSRSVFFSSMYLSSSVKTLPITDSSYWTRQITFCAPFNDKFLFRENYDECKPIKEHYSIGSQDQNHYMSVVFWGEQCHIIQKKYVNFVTFKDRQGVKNDLGKNGTSFMFSVFFKHVFISDVEMFLLLVNINNVLYQTHLI